MDFLQKYGIEIKNKKLLLIALTHSSYANEKHLEHYERLEYLGDAVLQLIISEYLYNEKDLKEGQMSKIRASYVCEECAEYLFGTPINLNICIRCKCVINLIIVYEAFSINCFLANHFAIRDNNFKLP